MANGDGQLLAGLGNLIGSITRPIEDRNRQEFELRRTDMLTRMQNERDIMMLQLQGAMQERSKVNEQLFETRMKAADMGVALKDPQLTNTGGLSGALSAPGKALTTRLSMMDEEIGMMRGTLNQFSDAMQQYNAGSDSFAMDSEAWEGLRTSGGILTPMELYGTLQMTNPDWAGVPYEQAKDDPWVQGYIRTGLDSKELDAAIARRIQNEVGEAQILASNAQAAYSDAAAREIEEKILDMAQAREMRSEEFEWRKDQFDEEQLGRVLENDKAIEERLKNSQINATQDIMNHLFDSSGKEIYRVVNAVMTDENLTSVQRQDELTKDGGVIDTFFKSDEYRNDVSMLSNDYATISMLSNVVSDGAMVTQAANYIRSVAASGVEVTSDMVVEALLLQKAGQNETNRRNMAKGSYGPKTALQRDFNISQHNVAFAQEHKAVTKTLLMNPQRAGSLVSSAMASMQDGIDSYMQTDQARVLVNAIAQGRNMIAGVNSYITNGNDAKAEAENIVRTVIAPIYASTKAVDGHPNMTNTTAFIISRSSMLGPNQAIRQQNVRALVEFDRDLNLNRQLTPEDIRDKAKYEEKRQENSYFRRGGMRYDDIKWNGGVFTNVLDAAGMGWNRIRD